MCSMVSQFLQGDLIGTVMLITYGVDHFKNVIQNLYDIGSITHGYLPESHEPLFNKK